MIRNKLYYFPIPMLQITYTFSPQLQERFHELNKLHQTLALIPVSPKNDRQLKYESVLNSVVQLGQGLDCNISISELEKLANKNVLSGTKQLLLNFKKLFSSIQDEAAGSPMVMLSEIEEWAIALYAKTNRPSPLPDIPSAELKQLCTYLSSSSDHAVVAAALAYMQWVNWEPFAPVSILGLLHSYYYLAHSGYDARGTVLLTNLFEYQTNEPRMAQQTNQDAQTSYTATAGWNAKESLASSFEASSANTWILFYTAFLTTEYQTSITKITNIRVGNENGLRSAQKTNKLTPRQRHILDFLDQPDSSINNRFVQKKCKISQITASRELANLVSLGYLLQHGRSRSIHYTKA